MSVSSHPGTKTSPPKCRPYFKRIKPTLVGRAAIGAGPWSVPDLCRAYNWPTGVAGGGVIAIVELDGGWVQSDMDAYFQSIGQPVPQITDVSVDATRNNPNQHQGDANDPDYEVALDIQIAAAAYFAATGKPVVIRVYWASDIAPAVAKATADGCDVCSISWGADEALWGETAAQQMEDAALAATTAGMIVFAASGDNDSSDGGPNPANVDVPSSCPHVIGCGGTTKTPTTETVWNNNPGETDGQGTGGGYSTFFPVQPWQAGAPAGPGRMIPDVAADADPNTGYLTVVHGQQSPVGGTSAAAPLLAGLFAGFGTKLGFVTPKLWANQLCFNDITKGDNGFYRAGPGPDPCTGLGSPIGTKLAVLLGASPAPTSALASPHPAVPAGWSGTVSYTYVNGLLVSVSISERNP
ncbi:MAG: S8 family serine peptidase [Isosphaeraceae bacterium]